MTPNRPLARRAPALLACLTACLAAVPAAAQQPTASPAPAGGGSGPFGFLSNLKQSDYMLGDMWGLRPLLSQYGMTFSLTETSEALGNLSGGIQKGFAYDGLTTMTLQLDTERAFGLHGGTFNVSGLQIHGHNLSADNLGTLQTASGIEADQATRLWELWYQQKFLDDQMDVKVGQQSLDQEFMVSQNALLFVNTMMGWPMVPSADMPGGGPAYPLSALGVRLRGHLSDSTTVLLGVFSGSPVANNNVDDSQLENRSGTSFPWNGTLVIGEVQYAFPNNNTLLSADAPEPLARTYKLGFWYDTDSFPDQAIDNTGQSLASPYTTGIPAMHRGDWAIYAVADQTLWVDPHESDRTINVFIRPMGTPLGDRNLINFSVNAGITMNEPFLHRDDDKVGFGINYTHVSSRAAQLDAATQAFTGAFTPTQGGETVFEATYQYEVTPWWQLQPDVQYVVNPGAGLADPNVPNQRVKNEFVLGLRTNITF